MYAHTIGEVPLTQVKLMIEMTCKLGRLAILINYNNHVGFCVGIEL